MDADCATRYPILLIHGTGFRDWKHIGYWGRIPEVLRSHGAEIHFGGQDGWASVEKTAGPTGAIYPRRLQEKTCKTRISLI